MDKTNLGQITYGMKYGFSLHPEVFTALPSKDDRKKLLHQGREALLTAVRKLLRQMGSWQPALVPQRASSAVIKSPFPGAGTGRQMLRP